MIVKVAVVVEVAEPLLAEAQNFGPTTPLPASENQRPNCCHHIEDDNKSS